MITWENVYVIRLGDNGAFKIVPIECHNYVKKCGWKEAKENILKC